jgi:hypothetical protein
LSGEKHCGTCVERKEAFELAGVADPTKYEVEGKIASLSENSKIHL